MLADYHLHSSYSKDSDALMEDMIQKAIRVSIDEVAFTEHVDYGGKPGYYCDYDSYFKEIDDLQKKYENQIVIKKGLEFGLQNHLIEQYVSDFEYIKNDVDFIILSLHDINNQNLYDGVYQKGKTQDESHQGYYEAFLELIKKYKNYSVLGHLDLIKRYDKQDYPDEKIMDIVERIFQIIIAEEKGIEINTSSFKYGMKDLLPSRRILKLYHDMGGTIITIGSDSHDLHHMGDHIAEVKEILRNIGFTHFCTFEKMKPIFHAL